MTPGIRTKICGLTRPEDVDAVARAGATYIGLNFFPKSPRFVSFETARDLAIEVPMGIANVGLVVIADVAFLVADYTRPDPVIAAELQKHGRAGVPLYLYYAPGELNPQVLPETLSTSLVTGLVAEN